MTPRDPFEPPVPTGTRPRVVLYTRIYAGAMATAYLALVALLLFGKITSRIGAESHALLIPMSLLGVAFAILFAVAALAPFKPWGWTVGLVAICVGLTSCSALFAIVLLRRWITIETKAAFGRL